MEELRRRSGSLRDEDNHRRDLRLALEQKEQASRLVETLTARCDSLRVKLIEERQSFERNIQQMREAQKQGDEERSRLEAKLREAEATIAKLEQKNKEEKRRADAFKKVADAALAEASEVMKAFT